MEDKSMVNVLRNMLNEVKEEQHNLLDKEKSAENIEKLFDIKLDSKEEQK